MSLKPAEQHLQALGISVPDDIDIEAIAFDMSALVKYETLSGCEASIVGWNDKAIIRVDPNSHRSRCRFSAAHECGHWFHHRGRSFRCRTADIGNPTHAETNPERIADEYAADLLMPRFMFEPRASQDAHATFKAIKELKEDFGTSLLATALRYVTYGPESIILVCHSIEGRAWFRRSRGVDGKWFPIERLDPDTNAYDILRGHSRHAARRMKMPADTWFDFHRAGDLEIYEESIPYGDRVLTLLTIPDTDE